ncbi:MAG TPA: thymidine phosphorylase, partial [Clostridiales bacterium]|nr:thymidine phosphorylase [Clostridiales bacterium]
MRISDIIQKKKRGGELTEEEIRRFVVGFTLGKIPDYQAAALLMAICFQGMTRKETHALCAAMAASGKEVDCSKIEGPTVDKHSTGGVGDKVTLIAAPIAAALGCKVAKMVSRGLDYTGGTGDKLDAVPGCRTALNADMFLNQVNRIGLALIGRTEDLSSADHKLFALRDVTGTAASLPLIASSVMSMKLATGCQNIILDVKLGSGSFMKTPEEAKELASLMVEIGKKAGRNVKAVITDMDAPLGFAVGNNLEVTEAIEVLNGGGPEDLKTVSFTVAALMYAACFNKTQEEAEEAVSKAVADGSALDKLAQMIRLQRGDSNLIYHPDGFPVSKIVRTVSAPQSGFLSRMNTEEIGKAARLLGAGREQKDSRIYYSAGIVLHAKPGDYLEKGQSLVCFLLLSGSWQETG